MKTTLDLPDDLVRQVKIRAVQEDRSMKDLVADYLRQGLGMAKPPPKEPNPESPRVYVIAEDGMPLFLGAPDAPASRLTIEELLALEQAALTADDLRHAGLAP